MSNSNYFLVKDKVQRFEKQLFDVVEINQAGSIVLHEIIRFKSASISTPEFRRQKLGITARND